MKNLILIFLFILTFGLGCKKKSDVVNKAPVISFVSQNPSTVTALKDSIVFTIAYNDADGDLGENNSNVENLFLTDKRINIVYGYRIKQLAPSGSSIAIKGNLEVLLKNTDITGNGNSENTTFSIYIVDRAGNKSNVVNSGTITINK